MEFKTFYLVFLGVLLIGCSSDQKKTPLTLPANSKGEYLYRHQGEYLFRLDSPALANRESYPWEEGLYSNITKEFFRCKGSHLNPVRLLHKEQELLRFYDCGGSQSHSLPLRNQKEFIYPILIDLLNYIQNRTRKRVVITSGHCCPDHNLYLDPSPANQTSKHLLGAEVDFYVEDFEYQPEKIVQCILKYYQETPKYKGLVDYEEFKRFDKEDLNLSTKPWYNQEIFLKLFKKTEGRDFDNRHPYPYLSIQVRYDWELKEKVNYSWEQAFRNFHRW
jgi:hypothetical protein